MHEAPDGAGGNSASQCPRERHMPPPFLMAPAELPCPACGCNDTRFVAAVMRCEHTGHEFYVTSEHGMIVARLCEEAAP
jgi:hypothetical protein